MRSWYEFGFSGFPTGEQRRRFYRQRDDPCDSEEECDYDDETNDRPVFHYPLRESEEGSRSASYASAWSSDASSASDGPSRTGTDPETCGVALVQRRRGRRSRRALPEATTMRCVLHSTLHEDMPAWYGATAVTLTTAAGKLPAFEDVLSLQHGGAPCASPWAISAQTSLWHWTTTTSHSAPSSSSRDGTAGRLQCTRVPDDPSLLSHVCWERMHPALRLARSSSTSPPPRIGHCAVALTNVDSALLRYFLADPHPTDSSASASVSSAIRGNNSSSIGARATASAAGLVLDGDVEVCASLVVGGASQLVNVSGGTAPHGNWAASHGFAAAASPGACGCPNLDGASLPRPGVLSQPTLCLTLWRPGSDDTGGRCATAPGAAAVAVASHHTLFLPLDTPFISVTAPRAFATLTPWVDPTAGIATAACAFAYLGGTDNGRDPLCCLELEMVHLHLDTWTWSCTPLTTYGARPAPRFGHSANVVDDDGGYVLMFGGIGGGRAYLNDLHVLDVQTRVWREVFLPSGLGIARRAFHMTAVLTTRDSNTAAAALTATPHLSLFAAQTRLAHQQGRDVDRRCACGARDGGGGGADAAQVVEEEREEAQDEGDTAGWSSSVTTGRSCGTLVLLGGECEGRPVAAAWACVLRNGQWQRLSFPLRTLPSFFHVAAPVVKGVEGGAAEGWGVRRQLPRAGFHAAVESLVERAARDEAGTSLSRTPSRSTDDAYMAACHGALAQLLLHRDSSCGAERLVVLGGSCGPPVSIATQVEVMGTSLKDTASLWLLAAQQRGVMPDAVLRRVPDLRHFLFQHNGELANAVASVLQPRDASAEQPQRPLSEADLRSNRQVSESVLDGQLTEWMRLARKRLRDSP